MRRSILAAALIIAGYTADGVAEDTLEPVIQRPHSNDIVSAVISPDGTKVIFGSDDGALMAADASNGKPLWSFQLNQNWKASPMTYEFDNKQYVAVAAGSAIVVFGLPD